VAVKLRAVFDHERAFALGLADRAAEVAMGLFGGDGLKVRRKADLTLVTQADTSIERMLREQIGAAFPDDRILGEEEGGSHDPSGRVWIVDPIDGTANFARGVQVWATLIALQVDGSGVLGVASAPALGERYVAVAGEGATLNGAPIRVSGVAALAETHLLLQEFRELLTGADRDAVLGLVSDTWRGRGFGDFWAHVLVARGSAEVVLEPELSIWDYAAIEVIVREAGGRASTFAGEPLRHGGSMLTTNGLLHDEVLARLGRRGGA
jgi:histidinol-phosphatase